MDFSLFYLGFDPINIAMLALAKPIRSQYLSMDIKCLFISKQSMFQFQTVSHTIIDIIILDYISLQSFLMILVLFRGEKQVNPPVFTQIYYILS